MRARVLAGAAPSGGAMFDYDDDGGASPGPCPALKRREGNSTTDRSDAE